MAADSGETLSIVIPSYNEEGNIERVIRESYGVLRDLTGGDDPEFSAFDIVVIDDHSQDSSPEILQRLCEEIPQLKVVRNESNIGCHPSTLVGFAAAEGDYQYFIPGDGQIPAAEMTKFLHKAREGFDVVYSWRVERADPIHRRLISGFYNRVLRLVFGIKIHDADSSSLLTKRAVQEVLPRVHSDSAFITVEILIEAERQGLKIGEVEIRHLPRVAGVARGLNLKDISKVPAGFFKMVWWAIRRKLKGQKVSGPEGVRN